jgi:protein gp37
MAETTLISWAHSSWNPWIGCTKCSDECLHCYIDADIRKETDWQSPVRGFRKPWGQIYLSRTNWTLPFRMQDKLDRENANHNPKVYKRVFSCSISDFFHPLVDPLNLALEAGVNGKRRIERLTCTYNIPYRDAAWAIIRNTPQLVYLILTKRPERILQCLPKDWGQGYPNVWLGTSVGCLKSLPKMDALRQVPVHPQAVRFVSHEPLLEDISKHVNYDGFGWVVAGGESGTDPEYRYDPTKKYQILQSVQPGRRTMDLEWAYRVMLCAARADIPFMFKQITAPNSGVGKDALGMIYQNFPPPPNGGVWAAGKTHN